MSKYLFIGGPCHGKFQDIPGDASSIRIGMTSISAPSAIYDEGLFAVDLYVRRNLSMGGGTRYVYCHEKLTLSGALEILKNYLLFEWVQEGSKDG